MKDERPRKINVERVSGLSNKRRVGARWREREIYLPRENKGIHHLREAPRILRLWSDERIIIGIRTLLMANKFIGFLRAHEKDGKIKREGDVSTLLLL